MNRELSGVADKLSRLTLAFPAKAGDTGKLYGSITPAMIAEALKAKTGSEIDRRQLDLQPIRTLGEHKVNVRLTMDLVPVVTVIVHREGESPNLPAEEVEVVEAAEAEEAPQAGAVVFQAAEPGNE